MTSELVVGVVFGRPVVGKMTLSYICLPFHSPTQASQLTGTSSYDWFRCHYPLITYLTLVELPWKNSLILETMWSDLKRLGVEEVSGGDGVPLLPPPEGSNLSVCLFDP